MRKKFIYNYMSSTGFGIYISGRGVYDSPEPDLEYVTIPGRSGDLIYDNNRFHNIEITYPCYIRNGFGPAYGFIGNFKNFQAYLYSQNGYHKLEDDYLPDHFRMASVQKNISLSDIDWVYNAGSFDLTFNCKPQLYLKSGDQEYDFTEVWGYNPTQFPSSPLIKLTGYGQFSLSYPNRPAYAGYASTITVAQHNLSYIMIDCELMDCYGPNGENANQYVTFTGHTPIVLMPGSVSGTRSSSFTAVKIKPRWWTV